MRASIALLTAPLLIGIGAPAIAQKTAMRSGDGSVDALIADLSSGKREAAISRISSIETLSGKRTLATTPTQFVDRLIGCTPLTTRSLKFVDDMIEVMWACRDGNYRTVFDPKYAKPYVVVGEFEDEATMKRRAAMPMLAPPAPPAPPRPGGTSTSLTPQMDVVESLAATVVSGKFDAVGSLVRPGARITLGRRNVVAKVTVTELDGEGPDAFVAQTRGAIARLGTVRAYSCESGEYFATCKFTLDRAGAVLIAMLSTREDKISYVNYIYATAEQALKDAAGPGQ